MDLRELILLSHKRDCGKLLEPPSGMTISLGESGKAETPNAIRLGLPDWSWPRDAIPCGDGEAGIIHAYHFLEHLPGEEAIAILKEIQRCLKVGGILQFGMPYYSSEIASQDLTHKCFWTESSFRTLFDNQWYDPTAEDFQWKLKIQCQLVCGVVERNLMVIGQLVKVE